MIRFEGCVLGAPRTKKNHSRLIRPGLILPSQPFCEYEKLALPQLRVAWRGKAPIAAQLNLKASIVRDRQTGDLVGYLQGLCDLLEKAGIVDDDRLIRGFDGSRLLNICRTPGRVYIVLSDLEP